jgi:hypothetical protein
LELAVGGLCAGTLGAVAFGAVTDVQPGDDVTLCPFRLVTGLPCPFCGLTRSMFALGRGDIDGSVHFSPIGPLVALVAALLAFALAGSIWRCRPLRVPRPVLALGTTILALSWAYQLTQGAGS